MLCFMVNLMPSCVDWFQISKSKKKNKKRIQCHRQLCSNRPLFLHNPRLTLFLNCKKLLPFTTTLTSSNLTRTIIVFFSLFLSHPFKVLVKYYFSSPFLSFFNIFTVKTGIWDIPKTIEYYLLTWASYGSLETKQLNCLIDTFFFFLT